MSAVRATDIRHRVHFWAACLMVMNGPEATQKCTRSAEDAWGLVAYLCHCQIWPPS